MLITKEYLLKKIETAALELENSPNNIFLKKELKKAQKSLNKFNFKEECKLFGIRTAKSIFKSFGVLVKQYTSTSIRGYRNVKRHGYEIDKYDPREITFANIQFDTFQKIVDQMRNSGFELSTHSSFSNGNYRSLRILTFTSK